MPKFMRTIDPALLPHARPCWCRECKSAYSRIYDASRTYPTYLKLCVMCGARFSSRRITSSFCGSKCQARSRTRIGYCIVDDCGQVFPKTSARTRCDAHFVGNNNTKPLVERETVECMWCLRPFVRKASSITKVCCTSGCKESLKAHVIRYGRRDRCQLPMCVVCDEPTLKGPKSLFCEKHKRRASEEARLASGANNLKNARRRSATHDGDPGITVAKLRDRDGDFCRACGFKIDFDAPQYDDLAPEIDHIVPLAREGTHTWDNVQLLHGRCNRAKGARLIPDRPTLFDEDIA